MVSQATAGRKNRLWFSFDGPETSYAFDQEVPDALWVGTREQSSVVMRGNGVGQAGSAYSRLPAGHPEGYLEAFATIYTDAAALVRAHGNRKAHRSLAPSVHDGVRGVRFIEAAVKSNSLNSAWISIP